MLIHKANGRPHPRCIFSWNSRNLSNQLLFDSGSSSPGAVFVFSSGSGPGGSGMWHANRDKHWVQLQFDSRSFSPGAVFIPSGSGPGGTNRQILWLGMWIPSYLGFADIPDICHSFYTSKIFGE